MALTADLLNKIQQTIDQSKKGITAEELKLFGEELINSIRALQQEANGSIADFLNEKIAEMRDITEKPVVVKNEHSLEGAKIKLLIASLCLFFALTASLHWNCSQYKANKLLSDNDLKYRYIKMANGILPTDLSRLENFFHYSDSAYVVDNIRKDVLDFERRQQEAALKMEQKR